MRPWKQTFPNLTTITHGWHWQSRELLPNPMECSSKCLLKGLRPGLNKKIQSRIKLLSMNCRTESAVCSSFRKTVQENCLPCFGCINYFNILFRFQDCYFQVFLNRVLLTFSRSILKHVTLDK